MKKRNLLFLILLLCALPLAAQRNKKYTPPPKPSPSASKLFEAYRFDEMLQGEGADFDSLRQQAEVGSQILRATQHLTFLDTLTVSLPAALQGIRLSADAGRVGSLVSLCSLRLPQGWRTGTAAYITELADYVIFSASPSAESPLALYSSRRMGGAWSEPQPLFKNESENDEEQGYDASPALQDYDFPYLLSDGVTLYFSARGKGSLGGRDLFVTRYQREKDLFFVPENLGFPFNSPADEYFYYLDEAAQRGYFLTARHSAEGDAMRYTFLPQEKKYLTEENPDISDSLLVDAAKINLAALQLSTAPQHATEALPAAASAFRFVLNDKTIYTSLDAFRSPEARAQAAEWAEKTEQYSVDVRALNLMRMRLSAASSPEAVAAVRRMETEIVEVRKRIQELEISIRVLENGIQ